jgi:TP901 family phage tail tape measure protein
VALSTREVFLVLRARDEATRTIARVSHAMSGMDRRAVTSSTQMIDAQKANLRGLSAQIGDVNAQYSNTIADAYAVHRRQIDQTNSEFALVRDLVREVGDDYSRLSREQEDMYRRGRMDAATYRTNMTALRRLRDDQLRSLTAEKDAIADVSRANQEAYHRRVIDARQLHNAQKETIRLERANAQEIIRTQQDIIDQDNIRMANLRDQGARLQAIGGQAVYAGATMTAMGAAGVYAFSTTVASAIDYEQQARRTLTQVDNNRIGLEKVADAGKRIADEVPVAFEQIQPAMYDVFSSIDVGMRGASKLTKQFAKDAVGGTTDIATATKANLAIMNAYGIEVKDVTEVSDFMFQLVRKGVGSYEEFAKTIGRAIPSAARAGQSYKTLGAMMAFMTRNGVSTAMAATASARALDAVSHPKTVANLEKLGIAVKDASGQFLPLPDILDNIDAKMGDAIRSGNTKKLYELFKGSGGTIQARRFFDMYFKNVDEFKQRTKDMADTAGEAERAFVKMSESPQAKIQALKNDWMLLRIELGENLMPMAMRVIETLNSWIDAFQRLSPEQQETITKTLALAAAGTALMGVLTVVAGGVLMFVGTAKMLGITAGVLAGRMGLIGVAVGSITVGFTRIVTASNNAERALGIFGTTAGGALAGFMVGGPIGAGVGALVGLIGGLAAAALSSGDSAAASVSDWNKLKDTLNEVTGATTQATRAAIYDEAQRSGLFDKLKNENLTRREIVDGIMGEEAARGRLRGVIETHKRSLTELEAAHEALIGTQSEQERLQNMRGGNRRNEEAAAEIMKQIEAEKALIASIEGGVGTLAKSGDAIRERSGAITDFTAIVKKVPPKVITRFETGDIPSKIEDVAKLQREMRLTPKEVKTIMKFLGIEGSMDQIDKINQKIKNLSQAKPDLSGFITGVDRGARNAAEAAAKGGADVAKKLKETSSKAKADLSAFNASVQSGVQPAIATAAAGGNSAGNALKQGLINGFAGTAAILASQAAGAVHSAIAAARAAAKAKSPSQETYDLGKDMADGLIIGWDRNAKPLKEKTSKFVRELLSDMASTMPQMETVLDRARELIDKKLGKMKDGKKRDKREKGLLSQVVDATEQDFKRLKVVVDRYRSKMKELETANQELERLKNEKASYISSLSSSLATIGNMSDIQGDEIYKLSTGFYGETIRESTGERGPVTLSNIISGFNSKLAQIKNFGVMIGQLRGMGFTGAVIDQILQMGPVQGYQYAQALLTASQAEVAHINAADAGITSTAATLAAEAGAHMYNVGIAIQQGIVDGLTSDVERLKNRARKIGNKIEEGMLEALGGKDKPGDKQGRMVGDGIAAGLYDKVDKVGEAGRALARAIIRNFNNELQIASPSRVGIAGGRNYGSSVATGMMREKQTIERAARYLAYATQFTPEQGYVASQQTSQRTSFTAPPTEGKSVHQEITINTQELDPRRHGQMLGWELANEGI